MHFITYAIQNIYLIYIILLKIIKYLYYQYYINSHIKQNFNHVQFKTNFDYDNQLKYYVTDVEARNSNSYFIITYSYFIIIIYIIYIAILLLYFN